MLNKLLLIILFFIPTLCLADWYRITINSKGHKGSHLFESKQKTELDALNNSFIRVPNTTSSPYYLFLKLENSYILIPERNIDSLLIERLSK